MAKSNLPPIRSPFFDPKSKEMHRDWVKWFQALSPAALAPNQTAAGSFADGEIPTGAINGANTQFTLKNLPSPSTSLLLFRNGVRQVIGTDFTLASNIITFTVAPLAGDFLDAWYRY